MDIPKKRQEVLEDIARQPANVVFARIGIVDTIQLADLLKEQFTPKFREAANTSHTNTDSLHEVCTNLAKQRALLQGASVSDILSFNIDDGNATTRANGTAPHNQKGSLTFPTLEDATYNNKTTVPYVALHDLNEDGGTVTLSSTANANTTIVSDEGESVKYFTDFSKYFLTRSRANGEIISIDENTAPYTTPTTAEPFFPANTINGEIFRGAPSDPTANSDVRYEFALTPNTTAVGFAGANNDITENKFVGNTYVILKLSNASGTFTESESIVDFDNNSATVKSASNTTTVILESNDVKGTFQVGEVLSDGTTNAVISSVTSGANTTASITLTGNTFLTGSNTDVTLGFFSANTITLDGNTVIRTDSKVVVTANNHGVSPGEYIVLKGATDDFSEFNDTFIVDDVTQNTLTFTTSNSVSVTPTGDFSLVKNIFFGRTSNASAAITSRTVNATAELRIQSANLSVGFPIGNTATGESSGASGTIDERNTKGDWYQVKTNEVKTYYIASDSGTWDYDATNNPQGFESTANTGEFWLKNFEMVKINQIVESSGTGNSFVSKKMVFDIALATSSDTSGGYDSSIKTQNPGIYLAYPLKTYEDQVHDGTTTLEAFNNFASVVIAPEGLEINFDWKPLANSSGVATNSTHINADGTVTSAAFNPEEVTVLDKDEFNAHLGPYNGVTTANSIGKFPNAQDDIFLSAISSNRSSAKKVGTSGAVYPSVNANPFFPAVGGTHKENSNTQNDITGTQPGTLTANDIYAGAFSERQKDAVEPAGDFRYAIQNDQKWIYASPSGIAYNTPNAADQKDIMFSGTATATAINNSATETADNGKTSDGSTVVTIPADSPVTCSVVGHIGNSGTLFTTGTVSSHANMVLVTNQSCIGTNYSCIGGSGTDQESCATSGGSWTPSGVSTSGSPVEFACFYNRVQYIMTSNGGALTVGATTNMETSFAVFYQLLLDLISASHGKDYTDPVERTEAASYSETGRSDTSFKSMVETMKSRVDTMIGLHNSERAAVISAMAGSGAYTHPSGYKTAYDNMISYLATFRDGIKNRITEISNRIGYLNGKNTAVGGAVGGFVSSAIDYLLLDGTDNSSSNAGDNILMENGDLVQLEPAINATVSVGSAGSGFTGYSFNGGNGYANTIYSHANFLAGKKIKLLEKIFKSIEDVDELYKIIKSKRSEYYEYNQ